MLWGIWVELPLVGLQNPFYLGWKMSQKNVLVFRAGWFGKLKSLYSTSLFFFGTFFLKEKNKICCICILLVCTQHNKFRQRHPSFIRKFGAFLLLISGWKCKCKMMRLGAASIFRSRKVTRWTDHFRWCPISTAHYFCRQNAFGLRGPFWLATKSESNTCGQDNTGLVAGPMAIVVTTPACYRNILT